MKEDTLSIKSDLFSDRIVKLHGYLIDIKKEYIISKQILRSGTSVGANVAEAVFGASRKDFINKLRIARKECSETAFWLRKLKGGGFITEKQFDSMNADCDEIGKIMTTSVKTAESNLHKPVISN